MAASDFALVAAIAIPAIHLLGVFSAVEAIMKTRTPQGSIAWALSLVTFPYVALPLYWVFGRNRFHGYIEALRTERLENHAEVERMFDAIRQHRVELDPGLAAELGVLERVSPFCYTHGNHAELLVDGKATFDAIFEAVAAARSYVFVQFFIIRSDELGRAFQALLVRKAKEGVRVHLLYDEIGCHALPSLYLAQLREAGVLVAPFGTRRGFWNRFQINFRNHRKTVVVDGRVAFVGGLNVGDEYLGRDPRFGHWRDTHLRVEGPAVQCVQLAFLADWFWATRTIPAAEFVPKPSGRASMTALVLPTGPVDTQEYCSAFFLQVIHAAKRRLWIASPYFVPDLPVFQALRMAALRGVDVRLMLPEKPDHKLVYLASFSFLPQVEGTGIRIYRYGDGFLHQKVLLVDDEVATVGTANLDNRSLHLNFELTMLVVERGFASQVAAMLERDFAECREATASDYWRRGRMFRVAVRFARLFEPIL